MNLTFLLASYFMVAASVRPETFTCAASEAEAKAAVNQAVLVDDGQDDEFYDLESMSDEELEEICTSRGFELVREVDADNGEPMVYTHQDFVDAAGECLQIEADLEEILEKHPEILEDVQKESERMMRERDMLLAEFNQQQQGAEAGQTKQQGGNIDNIEAGDGEVPSNSNDAPVDANDVENQSDNKLRYDFKEITLEVVQQMKSDFAKVVNFILPKGVRGRIQLQIELKIRPAARSFALVAKDMGMTAYGMVRRYLMAFVGNMRAGGDQNASADKTTAEEENTQKGATQTTMA